MVVISSENFEVTRSLGFTAQGLVAYHQRKVQRMEPGDRVLFYIARDRFFAATSTVTSRYFEDRSPTWKREGSGEWSLRVRIKPEVVLDGEDFMDACQLAPRLDYVRRWPPEDWYVAFAQTTLHLLPKKDFNLVEEEMRKVRTRKSRRPHEAAQLKKRAVVESRVWGSVCGV
jgi:hypothetical protein